MEKGDIFLRQARTRQAARFQRASIDDVWIVNRMADEVTERFGNLGIQGGSTLALGLMREHMCSTLQARSEQLAIGALGITPNSKTGMRFQCDEDRLPCSDQSFDTIVAIGTLDTVNDLPGALLLIRRALKPGGAFLGAFLGSGSGATLRAIVNRDAGATGISRCHPQIDVRAAGDLLARAGFTRSVADMETITARYGNLDRLIHDVRANGGGNAMVKRMPLARSQLELWRHHFSALADAHGRVVETFCPVYVTGFAPGSG